MAKLIIVAVLCLGLVHSSVGIFYLFNKIFSPPRITRPRPVPTTTTTTTTKAPALEAVRDAFNAPLTVLPSITLPDNLPVCEPNVIPAFVLSNDYNQCSESVAESKRTIHPDQDKTTDEIVTRYGYSLEVYNVTTHDKYILKVHRITGGPLSPPSEGKPSVYINHGLAGASDTWLIQYGDKNLAFKLVDAGYDVWLGNCRGTTYSLGHETLDPEKDPEYWDFSWHEMAVGDVPAVVNKIISVSGNKDISYIGYSMGTSEYFAGASLLPDLNQKLNVGIMLAPVAYQGHANNPMRLLAPLSTTQAQQLISPLMMGKIDEVKDFQKFTNVSIGDMCTPSAIRCGVCDNILYFAFGFDASQQNYTNIPNILSKLPNNVSIRTVIHFSQLMNSCQFSQYDYGVLGNQIKYGSPFPPKYDLTKIEIPTYLLYGDADNLAAPADVFLTRDHLLPTTVKEVYRVNLDQFNHLDFQFAKDADHLVYDKVLSILNSVYKI